MVLTNVIVLVNGKMVANLMMVASGIIVLSEMQQGMDDCNGLENVSEFDEDVELYDNYKWDNHIIYGVMITILVITKNWCRQYMECNKSNTNAPIANGMMMVEMNMLVFKTDYSSEQYDYNKQDDE